MSAVAPRSARTELAAGGVPASAGAHRGPLQSWARWLRLADWGVQLPILWLASLIYFFGLSVAPVRYVAQNAAVALCQALLLAGGYLANDYFDRHLDRFKPGHARLSAGAARAKAVVSLALLALGLAVAHALASTPFVPAIAWIQVVLGMAYSMPGPRLKERGVVGVLAAGLLQRLPGFAMVVLSFPPRATLALALAVWLGLLGVISLLEHQLSDEPWDRASGVRTWCVTRGRAACLVARRILYALFVSVTLAGAVWLALPGHVAHGPTAAALLAGGAVGFMALARRRYRRSPLPSPAIMDTPTTP